MVLTQNIKVHTSDLMLTQCCLIELYYSNVK